ncbi:NTP transferase domain-containing protein [Candidatus Woesearchaeota archaeon]|nr:NTP transferase domain-containing protein [Candidatus Woesearchaeota archaeon]
MKRKISITIEEALLNQVDSIIDNIYIRNRSQALEYLAGNALGEQKRAVILAGGSEERLQVDGEYMISVSIRGKTVLEHAVEKLRQSGFSDIFIVARDKILTKAFEILRDGTTYGVKVSYIEEKVSRGTATTLRLIKGKVNSRFLAVYGDIIFTKVNLDKLWEAHIKQSPLATLMLTTSPKPSEKGTIRMEGSKSIEFIQKPKKSDIYLVFSPVFVAEPELLEYPGYVLEKDVFPRLAEKGLLRGYLSSEKEIHIHTIEDVRKVKI